MCDHRGKSGRNIHVPEEMRYNDWKAVYIDRSKSWKEWAGEVGYKGQEMFAVTTDFASQGAGSGGIIKAKGGGGVLEQLSQARKKDHVFGITDRAIENVSVVNVPSFSEQENNALASLHREVLRIARDQNESKEVALITNLLFGDMIKVFGDENSVDYVTSNDVISYKMKSYFGELIVVHNHSTTRSFSFADIAVFVNDGYVSVMSVVTNQGQVYILRKTAAFNYDAAQHFIKELLGAHGIDLYPDDELRQQKAAREFVKKARRVGVWYGTGKR